MEQIQTNSNNLPEIVSVTCADLQTVRDFFSGEKEILQEDAGSGIIIDKDDGSVMRQDRFYLCRTAEGSVTYVIVDKDQMLWGEAGNYPYKMPQTASIGFALSDLEEGECIAYPADHRLVKRDNGALWTSDDPFGAGHWRLLD